MNTNELIELLSSNLEPVNHRQFQRSVVMAVVMGGVAAFTLMWMTVGPRPNLGSTPHLQWCALKLLFALSVVGSATPVLIRSARPGSSSAARYLSALLPFIAISIAAAGALIGKPGMWREWLLGATRMSPVHCLLHIVGFAAIPMFLLISVLREGAPTRPSACGAVAGVVACGAGAAAYALACKSDSVPFIAVWYSAAIAAYAIVGAVAGPRVLRW